MTVFEFLKISPYDYDVADEVFDATITVCESTEKYEKALSDYRNNGDPEYYYLFIAMFLNKVELTRGGDYPVANFYGFIEKNIEVFRKFSNEHWWYTPEDDDDLIYEWIHELDNYLAGAVSEDFYKTACEELIAKCN
jgi:hypothetical protein